MAYKINHLIKILRHECQVGKAKIRIVNNKYSTIFLSTYLSTYDQALLLHKSHDHASSLPHPQTETERLGR